MDWKRYLRITNDRKRPYLKDWLRCHVGPHAYNNWNLSQATLRGFVEQRLALISFKGADELPLDQVHNVKACQRDVVTERVQYTIRFRYDGELFGNRYEPLSDSTAITIKATMRDISRGHKKDAQQGISLFFDAIICVKDVLHNEGRGLTPTIIRQEVTVFVCDPTDPTFTVTGEIKEPNSSKRVTPSIP
jgi:23S rRNA U2552 (ribose-2'-O)-methylase RlmE/FtsJ